MTQRPPRWLECLLALVLPHDDVGRSILGDLRQEYMQRRRRGRSTALWYLAVAMALMARYAVVGLRQVAPFQDARFALRALRRTPWFLLTTVGVLALTVSLATTVFAIVDGVLFRPLPYPEAERLVSVTPGFLDGGNPQATNSVSLADIAQWERVAPDTRFTGFRVTRAAESGPGVGINEDTSGMAEVQPNFFDTLGVAPMIGGFTDSDFEDRPKYFPVILMYETWLSRFGGDPDVLGRVEMMIRQRDLGFRVVGIMPPGFTFPSARTSVDLLTPFIPVSPAMVSDPRSRPLAEMVARVPHGMSPGDLMGRLEPALAAMARLYADAGGARRGFDPRTERAYDVVRVASLGETLAARSQSLFMTASLAVVVLLLLAAVNLSSLMNARAMERSAEIQVRRSLGASPAAVVRLWFTESASIGLVGVSLGVAIAAPLLRTVTTLLPDSIALLKQPTIDLRVVVAMAIAGAAMCIGMSIAPIRRSLTTTSDRPQGGWSSERVSTSGRFLVLASQVAGAFILTVLGALLVGSLLQVYNTPLPIHTDGVVVLENRLHGPGSRRTPQDAAERIRRGQRLTERLRTHPQVLEAGLIEGEVLRGGGADLFSRPDGVSRLDGIDTWGVTGGFYRAIAPELVAGRLQTEHELQFGEPLIVVSERVASAYWPGLSPIGQTLSASRDKRPHSVVGVVKDVRWGQWDTESPMIYAPYANITSSVFQTFFLRTRGNTGRVVSDVVRIVEETDETMRVRMVATLDEMFAATIAMRRFRSWLFGGFAAAALLVAGAGILGVQGMSVARRTREVGVRAALGATPAAVRRLLFREQMPAVLTGLACGGVLAPWAVGFIEAYLYELSATDPRIWFAAAATVLGTAMMGALIPAVRASRIDPLLALRETPTALR